MMQDQISTHTNRQTFNTKHLNTTIIMDKKDETIKKYREVVKELQLRIQKQKECYEVARDKIQELSCEVGEKTELITSLKRKIGGYKTTLINQKRRLERVIDDMSNQYVALRVKFDSLEKDTKQQITQKDFAFSVVDSRRAKLEQEIQSKDDFIRTQSKAISDYCKALNEREKIIQDLRNELDLKDAMIADIKDASTSWLQRCFFWWR